MIEMDFSDVARGRREHDAYMTPKPLVGAIVSYLTDEIGQPTRVIEPSCGDGEFIAAMRTAWPHAAVYGVDVREECRAPVEALGAKFACRDFLAVPPEAIAECDLIVGNPPFSLFTNFVGYALDALRAGGRVAFLMRLGHLVGSQESQAWWTTPRGDGTSPMDNLVRIAPIHPRPSFTGGGTDSQEYALAIWMKGHRGDFEAIKWNKPKRTRKANGK